MQAKPKIYQTICSIFILTFTCINSWAYEPKLINMERFGLGHHQNDFLLKEDCFDGVDRCKSKLGRQDYELARNFIEDSLIHLAGSLDTALASSVNYQNGDIVSLFKKRERFFQKYSSIECNLENRCELGLICGRGDIGSDENSCLNMKLGERAEFLAGEIKNKLGNTITVLDKTLHLDTPTHSITIIYRCKEIKFDCREIAYRGTSKKSGASISLVGQPYFGRTRNSELEPGIRMLGYYFKNGNIEYFVRLNGDLKVYNSKTNSTLLEQRGVWKKRKDNQTISHIQTKH